MQTHLSYTTYQKLREKFGEEKIDHFDAIQYSTVDKENNCFSKIDMNVILSKEFIGLLFEGVDSPAYAGLFAVHYYSGGMPALEKYILSLL